MAFVLIANVTYAGCNADISRLKPNTIYADKANGLVLDAQTNLVWAKCSHGQTYSSGACTGSAVSMNWQDAFGVVQSANTGSLLGHNDWRLPNVAELRTLVDKACAPAINDSVFPTSSSDYWSSSPSVLSPNNAWFVSFAEGKEQSAQKDGLHYVRLVRTAN